MDINTKQKVISVELKEPLDGRKYFYFGSKKAMTTTLGKEVLGFGYSYIKTQNLAQDGFENKRCIVRQGRLITLGDARKLAK